jgi:hypothetical protein
VLKATELEVLHRAHGRLVIVARGLDELELGAKLSRERCGRIATEG